MATNNPMGKPGRERLVTSLPSLATIAKEISIISGCSCGDSIILFA
jgi:hypothetical protein